MRRFHVHLILSEFAMEVRLSPVGRGCKVIVAAEQDADWLREQLAQAGGTCSNPVRVPHMAGWAFYIKEPSDPQAAQALLAGVPGVQVTDDPG